MKQGLISLGVLIVFISNSSSGQELELPPRYYALVVGVKQYDPNELTSLRYAEADATELAKLLGQNGYRRVELLTQSKGADNFRFLPTSANIRKSLVNM